MRIDESEKIELPIADDGAITLPVVENNPGYFGFRVGGFGFLVSKNVYCEMLNKVQLNPLPNVRPWFRGLINLRGSLVPVFDLLIAFQEGVTDTKKQRLFVIGKGDKAVALWIEGNPELISISDSLVLEKLPILPTILHNHVLRGYGYAGKVWLDVEFAGLFKTLGHIGLPRRD